MQILYNNIDIPTFLRGGPVGVVAGLHQRCIQEVSKAWPGWIQRAAGKSGRARPSQDLRLLQYFQKATTTDWAFSHEKR